jgi:presenilin-like A22 family membrane protease
MSMFIVTQIFGLLVVDTYSQHTVTLPTGVNVTTGNLIPYGMQTEPTAPGISLITMLISLAIAIGLMLLLMKFKAKIFFQLWFTIVIIITCAISMNAIFLTLFPNIPLNWDMIAIVLALPLTFYKVFRKNLQIHNLTEILIYPGLAVIFVPLFDITTMIILLIIISIYDFIAVIKSKFMVKMAKFQVQKVGIFAGLFVPYMTDKTKKLIQNIKMKSLKLGRRNQQVQGQKIPINVAILGGGDIAFPLIFAGVVFRILGLLPALIVILGSSIGLLSLFIIGKKGKFYPAMPFITAGAIIGWLVSTLI